MNVESYLFNELSVNLLYEILKHRSEVFFLEQQCACEDLDEKDKFARHLILKNDNEVVAYARIFLSGQVYPEASIGRVLVPKKERGKGYGAQLTQAAIELIEKIEPDGVIRISAQAQVEGLYSNFGFISEGQYYDECGIQHINMTRKSVRHHG